MVFWFIFLLTLLLSSMGTAAWLAWRTGTAFFSRWRAVRWGWFFLLLLVSVAIYVGNWLPEPSAAGYFVRTGGTLWIITLPYWLMALALAEGMEFVARRLRRSRAKAAEGGNRENKLDNAVEPGRLARLLSRPQGMGALLSWHSDGDAGATPSASSVRAIRRQRIYWGCVFAVVTATVALGNLKFHHPEIVRETVRIEKNAGGRETLRIAFASDLHLGEIIGRQKLAEYVDAINALNADLVLLGGDLVNNRAGVLKEQDMGAELRRLKAPLGAFAVLGNHDWAVKTVADYFTENGVRVLRDECVALDDGAILLAGRLDLSLGKRRLPLAAVLRGADTRKPLIVLDHQPKNSSLQEGAENSADLYLSGHTHGGQVWPITWIVPLFYKVAHGAGRVAGMDVHVTSGLGGWGFPARIGSASEIVELTLEFAPKSPFEKKRKVNGGR